MVNRVDQNIQFFLIVNVDIGCNDLITTLIAILYVVFRCLSSGSSKWICHKVSEMKEASRPVNTI